MTHIDLIGYLASGLVLGSFCMKTIVPLRVMAVCSNIAFILYGHLAAIEPVLLLHLVLLPMNLWRLGEIVVVRSAFEKPGDVLETSVLGECAGNPGCHTREPARAPKSFALFRPPSGTLPRK